LKNIPTTTVVIYKSLKLFTQHSFKAAMIGIGITITMSGTNAKRTVLIKKGPMPPVT